MGIMFRSCSSETKMPDAIFIRFGTKLYGQVVGIPMGTNCAPLVADLFLFCYERDFMRASSYVADFNTRNKLLTQKLLKQGYRYHKLRKTFSKFYRRYYDLISKFQVGLISLLGQYFRNLISMVTWCIN